MNLTLREMVLAMVPFVVFTAWTLGQASRSDGALGTPVRDASPVEAFSCPSAWIFSSPSEGLPRVSLRWQGDQVDIESTSEIQAMRYPQCTIEVRFDDGPLEVFSVREVDVTRLEVVQSDWFTQSLRRSNHVDLVIRIEGVLERVRFETSNLETP